MATVSTIVDRPSDLVMEALLDPRTYPRWLVGCRQIRDIDPEWPAPGSRFHHRFGLAGPLVVDDSSRVVAVEPRRCLQLEVRARPGGRGEATFTVEPLDPGRCRVELREVPVGLLAPAGLLLHGPTALRNQRSLRNLRELVESVPFDRRGPRS
ncbi:MAG: SRPBCC family protein [Acidimicrobiales bacterium]|nr:SRPBCC family protein [Acidimicrobiales bacterium]HRW38729.1 SRPBCC family protein [Aquihabitans sp.]